MILSSSHNHTCYVDGKNPARDTVEAALALGFTSLGFSEHAYQPEVDGRCGLKADGRDEYVAEIKGLKREYAGRIRLYTGLEIDRVSPDDGHGLDYYYAANHYFTSPDGDWAGIDGNADRLEAYVKNHFGGSWDKAICRYFEDYAACVREKKPDIIAHFDLICKNNRAQHWFNEDGGALIEYGKAAMDEMIKTCRLLEINTGGMARSNQPCPYPVLPLLLHWKELGGEVIPAADCHCAPQVNAFFDAAEELMKRAGYEKYVTLGVDSLFCEVPLI